MTTTQPAKLPKVHVIATGGAMARIGRHRLDYLGHTDSGIILDIHELLARLPEVSELAVVESEQPVNSPSINFGVGQWLEMSRMVNARLAADPSLSGIAITHGLGTVDESAYFLNLTVKDRRPVVLTATLRPPSALGSDSDLNLVSAIRVAGSAAAAGRGVLVALNNEISAAREAAPQSTSHVQSFKPGDFGHLGLIDHWGEVIFYRSPDRKHTTNSEFDVENLAELPRVDIIYVYQGADGALVRAAIDAGARGLVFASIGPAGGLMPDMDKAAIEAARAGIAIVLSSRLGGRVPILKMREDSGFISADNLNPQKARVLLMLALTRTSDPLAIQRMYDIY